MKQSTSLKDSGIPNYPLLTFIRAMMVECCVGVREFSMLSGNRKGNTLVANTSLLMPSFLWVKATLKIPAADPGKAVRWI